MTRCLAQKRKKSKSNSYDKSATTLTRRKAKLLKTSIQKVAHTFGTNSLKLSTILTADLKKPSGQNELEAITERKKQKVGTANSYNECKIGRVEAPCECVERKKKKF